VQAFVRAEQQLTAAQDARKALEADNQAKLQTLAAENLARVAKADEVIRTRKTERTATLAGLAVIVNPANRRRDDPRRSWSMRCPVV